MNNLVKLISKTVPVDGNFNDMEEFIAYVARVSNPSNQENTATSKKLIQYLIKKAHWSPFEMMDMTFEINTTRDITHQIIRHRSLVFQEFSQRYADASQLGFVENKELRLQDHKNRQNSIETDNENVKDWWTQLISGVIAYTKNQYVSALNNGVAKEVARAVLPEGLTKSRIYAKGSIRSWIHYCLVRCHPGTQKEHREIALAIWSILCDNIPSLKSIDIVSLALKMEGVWEKSLTGE